MKKILIADQDKEFALSLGATLSDIEHRFVFVDSGKSVVKESISLAPDLIILRAELADLPGYSVCAKIRKHRKIKQIPILFI